LTSPSFADLTTNTYATIAKFNAAFNRHDVDAVMQLFTDDCRFENTSPAPDGTVYEGQAVVRLFWEQFFATSPNAYFEFEDIIAAGDRATVCWTYRWTNADGQAGHVRGVDVFTVRDSKVAEKRSYVKG
jgi:ketosteroid isomerase-like protein